MFIQNRDGTNTNLILKAYDKVGFTTGSVGLVGTPTVWNTMISELSIRRLIDRAEKDYEKCWQVLYAFKERTTPVSPKNVLDFQPRLATAFFNLGEMYQQLSRERYGLIARKKTLSTNWFARRMQRLSAYQRAITEVLDIGRVLGDSFAWIFYQNERKLVRKHFAHPPILQVPTGLGGKGELAFISEIRVFNGQFTIYHGITSFLRIGDVSFYDPTSKRITAIGELKTENDTGTALSMSLYLIWPRKSKGIWPRAPARSKSGSKSTLPPRRQDQLKRQLKRMVSSFEIPKVGVQMKIRDEAHLKEFKKLATRLNRKSVAVEKAGDGLLLMAIRTKRQRSLFSKLLGRSQEDIDTKLNGIEEHIVGLVEQTQVNTLTNTNSIFHATLSLSVFPGTTPIFWWPISTEFLRKLFFHEVHVLTVYNPAHFVRKLRSLGFEVELNGTRLGIKKTLGKSQLEMGNMFHSLHLIQQHLLREEVVLTLLANIIKRIQDGKISSNTRIELDTQLHY